jgi:hypothetical protein
MNSLLDRHKSTGAFLRTLDVVDDELSEISPWNPKNILRYFYNK